LRSLVYEIRDLCLDYTQNKIDEESLRSVDKKDIGIFIHQIETLLNTVAKDQAETEVYYYTE
jgi:hypothetical protein